MENLYQFLNRNHTIINLKKFQYEEKNCFGMIFQNKFKKTDQIAFEFDEDPTPLIFISKLINYITINKTEESQRIVETLRKFFGESEFSKFLEIDCSSEWKLASFQPIKNMIKIGIVIDTPNDYIISSVEEIEEILKSSIGAKSITIANAQISDFSIFQKSYPDVKNLFFNDCCIKNMISFPSFPSLKTISFYNCNIYDLDAPINYILDSSINFEGCEFFNEVNKSNFIVGFTNIVFRSCKIKRIDYILPPKLDFVKSIKFYTTDLISLHKFSDCPLLTEVVIHDNKNLRTIWGIPQNNPIENIVISRNFALKNLSGFPSGEFLTEIDISENNLSDIKGLPTILPKLLKLSCNRNSSNLLFDLPSSPVLRYIALDFMKDPLDISILVKYPLLNTISASRTQILITNNVPEWLFYRIIENCVDKKFSFEISEEKQSILSVVINELRNNRSMFPNSFFMAFWYCRANLLEAVKVHIKGEPKSVLKWATHYIDKENEPSSYLEVKKYLESIMTEENKGKIESLLYTFESKYSKYSSMKIDDKNEISL